MKSEEPSHRETGLSRQSYQNLGFMTFSLVWSGKERQSNQTSAELCASISWLPHIRNRLRHRKDTIVLLRTRLLLNIQVLI